jgi:hypothetical protein
MAIDPKTMRIEMAGNPDFWQTANAVNPAGFLGIHALGPLWEILHTKEVRGKLPVAIDRLMDVRQPQPQIRLHLKSIISLEVSNSFINPSQIYRNGHSAVMYR